MIAETREGIELMRSSISPCATDRIPLLLKEKFEVLEGHSPSSGSPNSPFENPPEVLSAVGVPA